MRQIRPQISFARPLDADDIAVEKRGDIDPALRGRRLLDCGAAIHAGGILRASAAKAGFRS